MKFKLFVCLLVIVMVYFAGCITEPQKPVVSNEKIEIKYYMDPSCGYCVMESSMFDNLTKKYPGKFTLEKFDISENKTLMSDIVNYSLKYNDRPGIPFVVINDDKVFSGYNEDFNMRIEGIINGTINITE